MPRWPLSSPKVKPGGAGALSVPQPQALVRPGATRGAPVVCTCMGRSDPNSVRPFRFIRSRSQATVVNACLAMYPAPLAHERLAGEPALPDRVRPQLDAIAQDDLLREGRVYDGGLQKLEPKELAKLPLALD